MVEGDSTKKENSKGTHRMNL